MNGSCGHELKNRIYDIIVKTHGREGERVVSYIAVCKKCKTLYKKKKLIIKTEEEEDKWLNMFKHGTYWYPYKKIIKQNRKLIKGIDKAHKKAGKSKLRFK